MICQKKQRKHFKFIFKDLFFLLVYVYLQVCEGAHGGQKRALEFLELKAGCQPPTVGGEIQT